MTLVRTRGFAALRSDQVAASEPQLLTYGVAIVKEAARLAGAASLPDPFTDADDSIWQTWGQMFGRIEVLSAVGFDGQNQSTQVIDSKAQRKIDTGESLVLMATNANATSGLSITMGLRFLFKLH
jgi:hypothetical protein